MATKTHVSLANRTSLITPTGFNNYDACMNPYVGCEFGCTYCYVRFFIKDNNHDWGDFVRVRSYIKDKLPKELRKNEIKIPDGWEIAKDSNGKPIKKDNGKIKRKRLYHKIAITDARLVIGTMTDPFQPLERKHRVMRETLKALTTPDVPHFKKVGIFTRSPIILDDLDLITKLPNARVHFTVTPFPPKVLRAIEPYSPKTERRWDVVKRLKDAGIYVNCNISPVIPGLSEGFIEEFVNKVIDLKVDEYFVDPMQPYKEAYESFAKACQGLPDVDWPKIAATMSNKEDYLDWKTNFFLRWNEERKKHQHKAPDQLPIWCDHENKTWVNMKTLKQMDHKNYGDEA